MYQTHVRNTERCLTLIALHPPKLFMRLHKTSWNVVTACHSCFSLSPFRHLRVSPGMSKVVPATTSCTAISLASWLFLYAALGRKLSFVKKVNFSSSWIADMHMQSAQVHKQNLNDLNVTTVANFKVRPFGYLEIHHYPHVYCQKSRPGFDLGDLWPFMKIQSIQHIQNQASAALSEHCFARNSAAVSLSANGTASWRARSIRPGRLPNQARRSSKSGSARNPRTGKCVTPTVTVRMATAWHVGGPFLTKPKTSASWASLSISELCVLVFDLIIQKLIYMRCMVHSCSIVCQRTSCSIVYQRTSCSTSVCPWHQAQVSS